VDELKQLQQSFYSHLTKLPSNIVNYIESTSGLSAEQRLSIYTSGYRLRLKEAISTDFNCLYSYLGDEMFDNLMDLYIDTYNSNHPSLRYYSQHMTELLKKNEPFSNYSELLEIAQIEEAFNDSFDAKNCEPISEDKILQITQQDWPNIQIYYHSSLNLLNLETNAFDIWKSLSEELTPPKAQLQPCFWVIWRKGLISKYRSISEAEAQTIKSFQNGADFNSICEGLTDYYDLELTAAKAIEFLQGWINDKMVCKLKTGL